ncbi:RagB/SusD family nutrient uptake outer membrane protein [Maribacter sp. 1_2014MBL_MicDiv]|uniref:RagB/SusD family nutrient uptake outer membrane protein n=1 Tax=Maribacter sp. 1_2014MBL_MicDiv TaxID=1644130 RepID=UPI0008F48572|nr:RagB/SusD family nutrient uptake outer membrane protein [Maribacter sp. 1_2014MBL_MicDiv]APA63203.1 carbohydrate-binding protein SusD [Maribacter sp. 1_2014MBL_MicDiv]
MYTIKISKRVLIVFIGMLFYTISCSDDILDQTNPNVITPNSFWNTEEDAEKGIIGAYSPFTNIWYYTRFEIFTSDYRDDVVNGFNTSERTAVGYFSGTSESNATFWVWSAMYQCVTRANEVLFNVPNIEMDADYKDNILGEAYFIRAFNYFNLVNNWLNVPLITTPISEIEQPNLIEQADPAEVWALIESDLKNAQALLPDSWSADDIGRVTSGAATGMLGKVFLYQEKYAEAKAEFEKVMDGRYQLAEDYTHNFTEAYENNVESLFEIQLISDGNSGWGADAPGVGKGAAFQPDLAPKGFTNQDGMRINEWVLDLYNDETTVNGEMDPRAFATLFFNSNDSTEYRGRYLKSRTYGNKTYAEALSEDGTDIFANKYLDWEYNGFTESQQLGWYGSGNNVRILRYADILLMFAEAEFMLNGSSQAALDAINQVRERADMPPHASITMQDIEDERVKELSLERTRYFDLLRWDRVVERIVNNPELKSESAGTSAYKAGREYIAIPQNEIDGNPNFKQNPGY